jgi:general secretion pathway protein M
MKEKFLLFWQARNPREQKVLALGAGLLLLALLYAYLWQPMNQERERLRTQLPAMRGALAAMKDQGREIAQLKTGTAATERLPLAQIIDQSAAAAGVKEKLTQVTPLAPDRVQVTLNSVAFDKWLAWLKALQGEHAVRVESAQIAAAGDPGNTRVQAVLIAPAR